MVRVGGILVTAFWMPGSRRWSHVLYAHVGEVCFEADADDFEGLKDAFTSIRKAVKNFPSINRSGQNVFDDLKFVKMANQNVQVRPVYVEVI